MASLNGRGAGRGAAAARAGLPQARFIMRACICCACPQGRSAGGPRCEQDALHSGMLPSDAARCKFLSEKQERGRKSRTALSQALEPQQPARGAGSPQARCCPRPGRHAKALQQPEEAAGGARGGRLGARGLAPGARAGARRRQPAPSAPADDGPKGARAGPLLAARLSMLTPMLACARVARMLCRARALAALQAGPETRRAGGVLAQRLAVMAGPLETCHCMHIRGSDCLVPACALLSLHTL